MKNEHVFTVALGAFIVGIAAGFIAHAEIVALYLREAITTAFGGGSGLLGVLEFLVSGTFPLLLLAVGAVVLAVGLIAAHRARQARTETLTGIPRQTVEMTARQ